MNYQKCLRAIVIWSNNTVTVFFCCTVSSVVSWHRSRVRGSRLLFTDGFRKWSLFVFYVRPKEEGWIGVRLLPIFNFATHILLVKFTQLQGLLCCPYMVSYIHCSRVKGTIVWFWMDSKLFGDCFGYIEVHVSFHFPNVCYSTRNLLSDLLCHKRVDSLSKTTCITAKGVTTMSISWR